MRKKVKLYVFIVVLGCMAAGLFSGCAKEKKGSTVPKEDLEAMVNLRIWGGDERARKEIEGDILNEIEESAEREQEDYEKAVEKGLTVTEAEIEKMIQESKEAVKNSKGAEKAIQEYCEEKGITVDEYWAGEKLRSIYQRNRLIQKYRENYAQKCGVTEAD